MCLKLSEGRRLDANGRTRKAELNVLCEGEDESVCFRLEQGKSVGGCLGLGGRAGDV